MTLTNPAEGMQRPASVDWRLDRKGLRAMSMSEVWSLVGDMVLLLLSVAFAVLAVSAWVLHGKSLGDHTWGIQVENAAKLGPTIFPIIFAALAGRSLKVVGRFMAAKGTKLGSLEAVTSSQSVWSTLECQLRLQQAGVLSVLLVLLWCLSPLGSQASLRVIRRGESSNSTAVPIRYRSTGPAASIFAFAAPGIDVARLRSVLSASARVMARHEDLYGEVKIPRFEALNSSLSRDGWKVVPPVLEREYFSSMVGIRVVGLPRDKETRFSLESSYASTECGSFVKLPYSLNSTQTDVDRMSSFAMFNFTSTALAGLMPGKSVPGEPPEHLRKFLIVTDVSADLNRLKAFLGVESSPPTLSNKTSASFRRLVLGSLYAQEIGRRHVINIANCTVSETRVESAVYCSGGAEGGECRVQRMRLSRTDSRPPYLTHFDSPAFVGTMTEIMSQDSASPDGTSSGQELFLYRGQSSARVMALNNPSRKIQSIDLSRVPPPLVGKRLSILINTYIQQLLSANDDVPFAPDALFRNATVPVSDLDLFVPRPTAALSTDDAFHRFYNTSRRHIVTAVVSGLPFVPAAATATATERRPVYVCSFAWLGMLLLASAALFATGAASLALQLRAVLAPDMLRYVASMTYANPYFRPQTPTPGDGAGSGGSSHSTALDGVERAKLLRRVRVRIADVNGCGDDGEVAFVATDNIDTRELERHRLYA